MNIVIILDALNVAVSFFLVYICIKMVLRTEKQLDLITKLFTVASIALLSGTLAEMYAYTGKTGMDTFLVIHSVMFTLAIIFFAVGGTVLYGIVKEGSEN